MTYPEYQASGLSVEKIGIGGTGLVYPLDAPISFTLSDNNNGNLHMTYLCA